MRSGDLLTQLVTFDEGFPDGAITWVLRDSVGTQVTTGTVTPTAGDVSSVISVAASSNTLAGGTLYANRELSWTYTVGGLLKTGHIRFRVEAFLPFGLSNEGVRDKLGVEDHEVEDSMIDLISAYANFQNTVTSAVLSAVIDSYSSLIVCDAIEALAALKILPTLQVKLASKEVSGVSQIQRGTVKWDELRASLSGMLADGYLLLQPSFDPTAGFGSSFLVVVRSPDPVTGV